MLDLYLRELENALSRTLTADDVQVRLAEAEVHLREGVDSRVEFGMTRDEAEKEAIEAFGGARTTARAIARVVYAHSIAVRLRYLAAAYATLAASYGVLDLLRDRVPFLSAVLLTAVGVCLSGVAITSFRARRSAAIPLLSTGVAASMSLWVFFGFIWLNLWNYGGMGYQSRFRAGESIRTMRASLDQPRRGPVDIGYMEDNLRAIPKAIADPIGNWVSQLGPAAGLGMSVAGLFTLVDIGFAAFGSHSNARRRRRRGYV